MSENSCVVSGNGKLVSETELRLSENPIRLRESVINKRTRTVKNDAASIFCNWVLKGHMKKTRQKSGLFHVNYISNTAKRLVNYNFL
ncbi:hypothetical protein AWM68_00385 [Fictibacillus phosphorivorans]|uniref:Uncharacterized protein n=1 Tax=Fictibacillus phosphorivorans TaxID=1221500 RepID=A0A165P2Q6_9BACL|nr:hypothetical protein AWM68_00385 [Fictibacillus phosphorivorans]